ncbi:MAG: hypothetical protein AAGF75_06160, partial [Cyanobacteria bacterium P01_H01_bin.130]
DTNLLGITLACMAVFVLNGYHVSFRRTSNALAVGAAFTALTIFPLFQSFSTLMNQVRIRDGLRQILERETITLGQQMELVEVRIDWNQTPFLVNLYVESDQPVTQTQVNEVENFLHRRLQRSQRIFKLKFLVQEVQIVDSNQPPYLASGKKRLLDEIELGLILQDRFNVDYRPLIPRWTLVGSQINWEPRQPRIVLTIRSDQPFVPREVQSFVRSLQKQMENRTGTLFKIEIKPATIRPQAIAP